MMKTKCKKTADIKSCIHTRGKTILSGLLFLYFFTQNIIAQTIPNNYFGINYWMPKKYIADTTKPGGVINYPIIQTQINEAGIPPR